jgi:hypothetical protein
MEFEKLFVLVIILPALVYFFFYCHHQEQINPVNLKFQFLFYWLFYGFSVPLDFVFGFEIIQPWAKVDYSQEKYFNSMLLSIFLFYSVLIGFLMTYREASPICYEAKSRETRLITIPYIILVAIIVIYFIYSLDDILSLSRMERNIQGENSSYRILKFFETTLIASGCVFILYNKNIKNVHLLTILVLLLGAAQGDRSSIIIPIFAWLLRFKPTIKFRTLCLVGISGIFILFVWKALYSFAIASVLGSEVTLGDMFQSFSISVIEPVSSYNLTTWVITDWGIGDIYAGYTIFVLPLIRALPRFLFEFEATTLAESFLSLYLPHIAATGGGRGFGIVAEFYLNFYLIGPFIFGILWGLISKFVNKNNSLVISFVFLLCNFRIFRSDVASVFKTYIILYGSIFLVWYLITVIINFGMPKKPAKL